MDIYYKVLYLLELYFKESNWKRYFLHGGCYWLTNYLHYHISDSVIMINRQTEHCALYFEQALYDVTGRIDKNSFHIASEREISFMKKNYVPKFDTNKLEQYLKEKLKA
ncbi:MAG: hypothetical protein IJ390_03160 [Lachnospiraceae bacterium]|nr:hypothetical protein [Lachnospiraceae bacterium]